MYFDAVLDDLMMPLFNGTPEETKTWLKEQEYIRHDWWVCIGQTMKCIRPAEYLGGGRYGTR